LILCAVLILAAGQVLAFPGNAAKPGASQPPANAPVAMKGTVVETMNSGGYSYVCVESGGQKQWAAMPATQVKVGDEVAVAPGMVMRNFTSKTLNRTFDSIIFSQGLAKQ